MLLKHFLNHKPLFLFISILIVAACKTTGTKQTRSDNNNASVEEWHPIFNGHDMEGWTPKFKAQPLGENYKNTFRVEEGLLRASYDEWDTFTNQYGHLFYKTIYSYYKIRSEYRFVGDQPPGGQEWAYRNNGLMLHSQDPATMTHEQEFPQSIEFQLLGGNGTDERSTGNMCSPGCHVTIDGKYTETHCINSNSKTYHGNQWVRAEAIVYGDSLIHQLINGDTVITYTNLVTGGWLPNADTIRLPPGLPLDKGRISIQAESHPTDFKSIEILNLCGCMDKKATNYKSYYVKVDNSSCTYN